MSNFLKIAEQTEKVYTYVATCFCNRDMPQYNLDWSSVGGCESDGMSTKRLSNPPKSKDDLASKLDNVESTDYSLI